MGRFESGKAEEEASSISEPREHENTIHRLRPSYENAEDDYLYAPPGATTSASGQEPTEHEMLTLRKVPDKLPWSTFLIAIVELCERFAYYGLIGPFQNYMANSYHDPNGLPGAIGLSQPRATALSNFFVFWCYLTPILGAIVADQYLGKYLTILYFSIVYMIGIFILFITSLPFAIEHGAALGGLVTAMIIIGLGTGGIKSNVSPLIAEQYTRTRPVIKTLRSGERVIVDPAVTVQRIYMIFYLCINIGSLSSIATTNLEKYVGFWSAYLLPFLMFAVGFWTLVQGKDNYVVQSPKGSIITQCFKALWIGLVNGGNMDAAKPSYQAMYGKRYQTLWTDTFVDELKQALLACKVFMFYPIYWAAYSQMSNNFVTQAGQMQLHGIPNDIMQNIDPLTIIFFIPICDRIVYPALHKTGFAFKPIARIYWGFLLASLSMLYATFLQIQIYKAGPCYDHPAACEAALKSNGRYEPNNIHVAFQTPAYILMGFSEIFASVTGLEYAFTKAPASMKSFIMSLFLLTSAFGAALGLLLSPTAKDPYLVWMYAVLATTCFIAGTVFWRIFRKYDRHEDGIDGLSASEGIEMGGQLNDEVRLSDGRDSYDDQERLMNSDREGI